MSYPHHMLPSSKRGTPPPTYTFNPDKDDLIRAYSRTPDEPKKLVIKDFSTQDISTHDPWPQYPAMFGIESELLEEGRSIRVKVPTSFIGARLSLHGTDYKRYLQIEAGLQGMLVEKCPDISGSGLGGRIIIDSSLVAGMNFQPTRKIGTHTSQRKGSKIWLGTCLEYLSTTYKNKSEREMIANVPMQALPTPVVMKTVVAPAPVDLMTQLKSHLTALNAAAKDMGLTLFIKDDGSVGARMEF